MADSTVDTNAIAATALRAQQARMRVIAENVANADSMAATAGGDPYRRQTPVFETMVLAGQAAGVRMSGSIPDPSPFRTEYSPGSPAADAKGYVKLPNVEPLTEALDMKEAQRAYEASLNVIENQRAMDTRTLDLLKG
jgi:flagellar basal-body rod protein FlgC